MKADKNLNRARGISYTRLFLSLLLTVLKFFAGLFGNSTALLADAVRSFSDFLAESVKLLDLCIASKPKDESHNYGHGKVATLCVGAGALLLLITGIQAFSLGLEELFLFIHEKEPGTPETIALVVAGGAFISREIFLRISRRRGLGPDSSSYASFQLPGKNTFISGVVLLGIGCTFLPGNGWDAADSFTAVLVSLYLLGTSAKLLYGTVDELIEASLDEESNRQIRKIIDETEGVIASHELKTRKIGKGIAINVCISVHETLNVQEAAEISKRVESRLKKACGPETYTLIKAEPDPGRNCHIHNRNRFRNGLAEEGGNKTAM
ncbi:cation transporter [Methanosarcina sp. KYL-1]|uniref:cation diffusion facilitator family transporter n=1 Tax=Methanosarcina sp. KYL-1 TaxID=2602068 RepID=UPI0021008924|nr:cation diffusion facilitator family transporter [Methanosarcina sp. KYL-1]MCQ1535152.1 cation transporter [Methanosarcina sp. KYL-1]